MPAAPRNATLDVARGLGIVLVVLGHNWVVESTKGELFRVVFSFHVPLFFFLSGVLLRPDDRVADFVRARADALLKPYFVVLLALGAAKSALSVLHGGSVDTAFFEGVLYGTGRTLYWIPMWFLPHLFVAVLAALLLLKTIRLAPARWLAAGAALVAGVALLQPTDWPWSADLLPISSAFVVLGFLCRDRVLTLSFDARWAWPALAGFVALHAAFDETIDLNIRYYGQFAIATTQALLGIALCLWLAAGLARLAPARRLLALVGQGTLFVLIFHTYFQWKTFGLLEPRLGATAAALVGLAAGVGAPLLLRAGVTRSRLLSAWMLPRRR
jgi:fucose 4-O-acetylase-like acetyltransferase